MKSFTLFGKEGRVMKRCLENVQGVLLGAMFFFLGLSLLAMPQNSLLADEGGPGQVPQKICTSDTVCDPTMPDKCFYMSGANRCSQNGDLGSDLEPITDICSKNGNQAQCKDCDCIKYRPRDFEWACRCE